VTTVTSGNGLPAHEVQWTDSAGLPRSAVMVNQSASGPGYLYSLTYQYNGDSRVCAGTGITGYPGDGFVENHNTQGSDNNSLDDSTPGTTTLLLNGNSHLIIQYSMPTYQVLGETIPTTICWLFADGRSNPIFALSQDARATAGNLGADTRSPYGSLNFDGTSDGSSDLGGASYGDTLKFVTLAANPEEVTGLSGWIDSQANTIPYAMEWINPAEVNAEMGHVATVPITVQDQGSDRDLNSTLDPRTSKAPNGPMIPYGPTLVNGANGPDAWAFQLLDYILHPDYDGDTQGAGASVQASYAKLAWGSNFGKLGGYNNGNNSLNSTQYSQHYNSGANILTGTRVNGMLLAYSVFEVLGAHNGSYTNGAVGQTVVQMQNVTQAAFTATIGTVAATGPAGVGNATNATITYSPAGFNPTFATWEITALTNTVNATLTVPTNYPLDHPIFLVDGYNTNQIPASIAVGPGLTNAGVDYFATLDTNSHRLWLTVNRSVTNALNLVVKYSFPSSQPAPVVSSFSPTSGLVGTAVTITGQNLTNATVVTFNGVAVASFTIVSATKITTTVPAGTATGPVAVTTPGGTVASTASFTVTTPAPTITSFTPTTGPVGTSVVITGANLTGATAVAFNGVAATTFTVNSATQITTTVPTGATTGELSASTPGGTGHSTTSYTVTVAVPAITSFSPTSGPLGTSVVITGSNLTGATAVTFNGEAATSFTVNSAAQVTAVVPVGATTGKISVTTTGGTAQSTTSFAVTSTPAFINGAFIKGANLPWLDGQYDHDIGTNEVNGYLCAYNATHMNQYLASLHGMGITVVRLWLNENKQGLLLDASGNVTNLQSLFLTNLDNIVKIAGTNGVSLYLTLNQGDSDWVLNPTRQASYIKYAVTPLATRYKGNPNLFGFDVMNEIDGVVQGDGATWTQARAYVSAAVSAIHTADSTRLATCSVGYVPAWPELTELTGLGLDFYDFHDYEDVPTFPNAASLGLDKPVFIGECGQGAADTTYTDAVQSNCMLNFLNQAARGGYAGVSIWSYQYPGCPYDALPMVNPDGTWRSVCYTIQSWNYQPAPVLNSFSPATGAPGAAVVITGQNLTNATAVSLNGTTAAFTVNAATQITLTVPSGATSGPLSVTTPGGTIQSTNSFLVQAPAANLPIYVDGLVNGFLDYSWATNVNDYNSSPVYAGTYSISVTASAYTALSLYHADFSMAPYASLGFWINGGTLGASGLQVMGVTNVSTSQYAASTYNLPPLPANTWTQFNIPLSALGVANVTNCQGFWFWPTTSGATTFYVDSVQLNVARPPALSLQTLAKPTGSVLIQLSGLSGQSYWLQTSTNLSNWITISTNQLVSASLSITNLLNPAVSREYWRVVMP